MAQREQLRELYDSLSHYCLEGTGYMWAVGVGNGGREAVSYVYSK